MLVAPVAAPAAEPGLAVPALAGSTTVAGVGTVAMDVLLPEGGSFLLAPDPPRSPGWATLTTTGSYAAIALVHKTETLPGGSARVNVFELHLVPPDACSGDPSPVAPPLCIDPYNHVVFQTATPPSFQDGAFVYSYPPGEYTLYLLTDRGATATATFALRGLPGEVALKPSAPAGATFHRARATGPAFASLNSRFEHVMQTGGVVTMGLYHLAADPAHPQGLFGYQECLTRGTPGPLSPNECVAAALVGQDVEVAGQRLVARPAFAAGSFGGFTLDNSGLAAWQGPTLSPGLWTNTFRLERGGIGPAIGTWALWLEIP